MIACRCFASSAVAPFSRRNPQYPVDPTFHCSFLRGRISMYSDNCCMQERQGWRREVSGKSSRSMLPDQSLLAIDHDDHFHGSSKTSRQEDYCGSPTRASYEGQPFWFGHSALAFVQQLLRGRRGMATLGVRSSPLGSLMSLQGVHTCGHRSGVA